MNKVTDDLDLTLEFQREQIKLYSDVIKTIFDACDSIQMNSVKEILEIVSKNIENESNKKIQQETQYISKILNDIRSLFKAKNINEIKDKLLKFEYSMFLYEECYTPQLTDDYYEQMEKNYAEKQIKEKKFEKEVEKERLVNKQLYGLDYANYHAYNRFVELNDPSPTIKDFKEKVKNAHPGGGIHSKEFYKDIIKRKNYEKFYIKAYNPQFDMYKVSKRKLPTEIFKYLFANGFMTDKNLTEYSTNQFGRTFETKRGDIQTEEDMKYNQKNLHRYNKVDFSKIPNSKYNKTLYISNQWDYDSITEFNKHINERYKGIIFADEETNIKILQNLK